WVIWAFVPTAPHWAALELLPLIAFVAAAPFPSMRAALRLLPLLVLQCLTDLVYVAPAVLGPLGVLAAIRILRRGTRAAGVRLATVLALTLPALLPVYRGYLGVRAANPNLSTQTWWVVTENTFPAPLPDRFLGGNYPLVLTPVAMALVGVGALVALGRRRAGAAAPVPGGWAHGALWAVVGAVLSLPALVTANAARRVASPAASVPRAPARGALGPDGLGRELPCRGDVPLDRPLAPAPQRLLELLAHRLPAAHGGRGPPPGPGRPRPL